MANAFDQFDSTIEGSNPFDQFDSTGQELKPVTEKPKTFVADALIPSFLDTIKEVTPTTKMKGSGLMDAVADVALGIPEAIGAAAGGLGQFIGGVVTGAPSMVEALPQSPKESFSPARGARAALEAGEKAMKPFAYEPKTGTANLLLSPITVGFGTLNKSLEKIIRGYHGPEADPKLVEDRVKGGQYVLNAAILGLPMLKGAKTVKDIDPADIAKLDSIKEQIPELKDAKTEDVFDILRQESIASEMPSPTGQHPDIIIALTEKSKTSDRPSMYKNVINLINTYEGDFVADFNNPKVKIKGISNKKDSSIRKTIQEVLDRRVGEDVPLETPSPTVKAPGDTPIAESGNAVLNNETQQPPVQGWMNEGVPVDVSKGVVIKTPEGVEGWIHNPEIVPFDKSRVASRKRVRKAGSSTQVELQQYPDVESVKGEWELGSEISRAKALEEVQFDIGGDGENGYELVKKSVDSPYSAVQVEDKYYRVVKKPAEPMKAFEPPVPEVLPEGYADTFLDNLKDEEFTGQGGVKEQSGEPIFEGTRGPDKIVKAKKKTVGVLTAEDLKAWREGHIAEINAKKANATFQNDTQQPITSITSQDLPIISDRFKTYESPEAAKADGVKGKLLQDPETGRWMEEPRFEDDIPELFQDLEVESPYYPERKVESIDDFDGELEYDSGRNLWELMNNERGAVEIDPVAVREGLKRFYKMAKDAADRGMTFPDYLTFRGISEEGKRKLLKFQQDIPEYKKIVREYNPVNYDILNPPAEEIVYRRVIHNKAGDVISQGVPITKGDIQRVLNAEQGKLVGGKVAEIFTIPTYRWEDFGTPLKKRFFRNWERNVRKLDEGIVEGRVATAEIVKKFSSKKEREDFFYGWTAQQKMGKEHLKAMKITKIPEWTPKFEEIKQEMQARFDKDLDAINDVRINTGRAAIKRRDNYFPLIHAMNKLHEMGIKENLSSMPLERISVLEKKYNGPSTWFDKPRKLKTGVPIELDPFEAFDKYHAAILQEVHMGPIAALAKELANFKYPVEGKSKPVGLDRLNPNLQEFLRSWSDDILGKDPMWEAVLRSRVGPLGKWFDKRVQNIAPARLGYKLTTGLVQFSGLVPVGTIAGPLNLAWGITEALTRRGIGRLEKLAGIKTGIDTNKSWKLSTTLHNRLNKGDELLASLADNLSSDNAIKHWQKNASLLMNYTDALTSEMAFYAFLLDGRRQKMSMLDAIEYADDMVGKTQGLGIKGALSPVQASKISSWAFKMQTFLIANANVINREVLGVNNPNVGLKKGLIRGIRILVGMQIANEAFKAVGLNSPFPDPIEAYEESEKKGVDDVSTAANMLKEYMELVPGGGGSIKYNSSLFGIVGGVADDFPKDLNQGIKLAFDWENMSRTERINAGLAVGDMLGTYYGVPGTSQLKGMIRNAVKGEDWYTVILGAYQREAEKKGEKLGQLKGLKGLDK